MGQREGFVRVQDDSGGYIYGRSNFAGSIALTNADGMLFFTANGQLWKSDGTPAGTEMLTDINPGGGINPGALPRWNALFHRE